MNSKYIQELYEYNRWANARVLDAVSKLGTEDFTRDLKNSFRSVRDTLIHAMSAEWIWLTRWKGISPKAMVGPSPSDFPTAPILKNRWAEIERDQTEFVSGLTDESFKGTLSYTNTKGDSFKYPLWQMMSHVVNHSTYHRGQVTTMLRQLGAQPAGTDLITFYNTKVGQKA